MGYVRFTRNNPDFTDLDIKDQVDFYAYMIPFDVMKNREYSGQLNDIKNLKEGASFELIKDQPLLIRMMTFIAFGLLVALLLAILITYFLSKLFFPNLRHAPPLLFNLLMSMVLFYVAVFLITHLQDTAQQKLEDINDNI